MLRKELLRYILYTLYIRPATWGGVGWGGGLGGVGWGVMTCTVLAHKFDATQLYLRTCLMLRNCTFAHVGCYAISLAHMFNATQLHLRTCSIIRHCICAHVRCYALALAHMFDATQLHLRACSMLRNCTCAERQRNVCRCPRTSRREGQAMDSVLNSCV